MLPRTNSLKQHPLYEQSTHENELPMGTKTNVESYVQLTEKLTRSAMRTSSHRCTGNDQACNEVVIWRMDER